MAFRVPIVDIQQIWSLDMMTSLVGRKWWLSKASAPLNLQGGGAVAPDIVAFTKIW